jgi:DNA-binding NarL/FixJ family response regulator
MASVLIVDDNHTFADALQIAIDGDPNLHCVGIADSIGEAVEAVRRTDPEHCFVNLDLRDGDGIEAIRALRRTASDMALTVLTGRMDSEVLRRVEDAGASNVVPKQSSLRDVLAALRSPHTGRMVLPGSIVVDLLSRREEAKQPSGVDALTAREYEVLGRMAEGTPPKVIARGMGISVHTVRGHVKNIYWKLDAHNQLEAVAIARRRGLLSTAS